MSEAEEELRLLATPEFEATTVEWVLPAAVKAGCYDALLDSLAAAVEERQGELKAAEATAAELKPGMVVYFTSLAPTGLVNLSGTVTHLSGGKAHVDVALHGYAQVMVCVPSGMVAPA